MHTPARLIVSATALLLLLTACAPDSEDAPPATTPDPTPTTAEPSVTPSPVESETAEPDSAEPEPEIVTFVDATGAISYDLPADWIMLETDSDSWLAYSEPTVDDDVIAIISMQPAGQDDSTCTEGWTVLASESVDPLPDGVVADEGELVLVTWLQDDFVFVAIQPQAQIDEQCMGSGRVVIGDVMLQASTPYRVDEVGDLWEIGGEHASVDDLVASDEYVQTLAMFRSLEVHALA